MSQGFAESKEDPQLADLAMLSLAAVYADILPGYKIRIVQEDCQVSKEVQMLRDFESRLLNSYEVCFQDVFL